MKTLFLHGLESTGNGTKGRFFKENFPHMIVPDFSGDLDKRLTALEGICGDEKEIVFAGSSFGGLMATCFAASHPKQIKRLILLAPALNYPGYTPPREKLRIPTRLYIGTLDTITPAEIVLPLARQTFADLHIEEVEEDHLLHQTFITLDWQYLLQSDPH